MKKNGRLTNIIRKTNIFYNFNYAKREMLEDELIKNTGNEGWIINKWKNWSLYFINRQNASYVLSDSLLCIKKTLTLIVLFNLFVIKSSVEARSCKWPKPTTLCHRITDHKAHRSLCDKIRKHLTDLMF